MSDAMETMCTEQIDVIAEILGQRKNANYCTMSNFGTGLLKFIMGMVGQSYESRTMNYDCVKMVLEHVPEENFGFLKDLILTHSKEMKKRDETITSMNKEMQKYRKMVDKAKAKQGLLDYWRRQAIIAQHTAFEHTDAGYMTRALLEQMNTLES